MRISDWSSDVCSSDLTPLGAIIMGEVLAECDILPEGAFSILPATRAGADLFTTDERLKLLSFTGSPGVGWDLKAKAGKKKVVLELGGNAAVIVDKDADLDHALRSEEHTSELQSLMRISYAFFCLKKKKTATTYIDILSSISQIHIITKNRYK